MANYSESKPNSNEFYYEPQQDTYSFTDEVKLPAVPFGLRISGELMRMSLKNGPDQIIDVLASEAENIINDVMNELYEQVQAQVYTKLTAAAQTLYQQPIESIRPKKTLPTGYDVPEDFYKKYQMPEPLLITQEQYEEIKADLKAQLNMPNPFLKALEQEKPQEKPYADLDDNYTLLMKFKQHPTQQKQAKAIITDIAEA